MTKWTGNWQKKEKKKNTKEILQNFYVKIKKINKIGKKKMYIKLKKKR